MGKKRKKFFKWCLYVFTLSIVVLTITYIFESDFRWTMNGTFSQFRQSVRMGTLFSTSENYFSDAQLLAARFKLGMSIMIHKYLPKKETNEVTFLGYKVRCFDLRDLESSFGEIFLDLTYSFKSPKKSPLIIDCGSNIGMSILFFKTIYPDAEIIGFEPNVQTFELLKDNIETNRLKNVTLYKSALSNEEGQLLFYYDKPGDLTASLFERRANKFCETVKGVKLSRYLVREVDFLKLDIEGAESLVFEDLQSSGKIKLIRAMVVEYHHHIDSEIDNISRIFWILESNKFGYQVSTRLSLPFKERDFQDVLIYAYRK